MFKRGYSIVAILMVALVILVSVSSVPLYSISPMSTHEDNYFVSGKDDVLFKMSIKYNLIYPFSSGLYFAYTETAFWNIYDKSSPFREFNHNPEIFYMVEENNNLFGDSDLSFIDYITFGLYEHKSNGRDDIYSRSLDRSYIEVQCSTGNYYNIGLRLKVFAYYDSLRGNEDLPRYVGYTESELFLKVNSKNTDELLLYKIYIKGAPSSDFRKGWIDIGFVSPIISAHLQPRIFINIFHGYGESLVDYNKRITNIRCGLMFVP